MTVNDALGWALLHFLWQGAAIAFLLAAANQALREATARARYAAACGAMLLMLACAAGTFAWLYSDATPSGARFEPMATAAVAATGITEVFSSPEVASPPAARFSSYLPLLVYFWFAGVCLLGIRSLGGWVVVQRLRRQASRPADDAGQQQLARLARRLGITRLVRLRESAAAQAPAVIGWLKPVVLLPVAVLGGLSPQQLEALLAHELAHIRRHDYLVNLLQTAVETLLFYHPAVWWVGRRIRAERENCCDDLAVEVCGDALLYARALARLEQFRHEMPELAMASNRGSLLNRIQRLLCPDRAATVEGGWQTAWNGAASVALCLVAAWAVPQGVLQSGFSQELPAPAASPNEAVEVEVEATPVVGAEPVVSAEIAVELGVLPVPGPTPSPSVEIAPLAGVIPTASPVPAASPSPAIMAHPAPSPEPPVSPSAPPLPPEPPPAGVIGGAVGGVILGVPGGVIGGVIDGVVGGVVGGIPVVVRSDMRYGVPAYAVATISASARASTRAAFALQAAQAAPQTAAEPAAGAKPSGFLDGLSAAGYRDLSVDQLIQLKTHGVTPEYVGELQAAGFKPSADELVKLRIHGVTGEFIGQLKAAGVDTSLDNVVKFRIHGVNLAAVKEMTALGYKLSPDDMVKMRIHGLTPELAREAKQLGLGDPSFEQLLKMQIHGVNQEFITGMKGVGLRDLNFDQLVKLRIHGADPAQIRAFTELGYKDLTADTVVKMRVHGVTPEFIREVQRHGFKDLTLDKIIKLKQLGIVDEPAFI